MFSSLVGKRTPNPNVTVIEHDALKEALRGNECVIVDVREPNEYSSVHIPGAINHPMSRFDAKLLPSGKRVVLVCQSGERFAKGARKRSPRCLPSPRRNTWLAGGNLRVKPAAERLHARRDCAGR